MTSLVRALPCLVLAFACGCQGGSSGDEQSMSCQPYACGVGECGNVDDGCGGTLHCGGCDDSETCAGNVCCAPVISCPDGGCGEVDDGCGGFVECGDCDDGFVCAGNVCCAPATSCAPDACGKYDDGCGGIIDCGDC